MERPKQQWSRTRSRTVTRDGFDVTAEKIKDRSREKRHDGRTLVLIDILMGSAGKKVLLKIGSRDRDRIARQRN